MRRVFADTSFFVALLLRGDNVHTLARAEMVRLRADRSARFVTCDAIFVELLAHFARSGPHLRRQAINLIGEIRAYDRMEVVPQSRALFDQALVLYAARLDQSYSLTDCVSMVICPERGITEVLTADRDFVREGFAILLG